MTRFWRDGHYRYRNGQDEWVSGHWVDRDDWDRSSGNYDRAEIREWVSFRRGTSWPRRYLDENEPNASCPVCGESVWFFRNANGGCAYFDEVGKPWPKHPCMDSRLLSDRTANWQAQAEYRLAYEKDEDDIGVRDARAAHADWAIAVLNVHTLELDVRKNGAMVRRAIAATRLDAERPGTKRQRRERLSGLRERMRVLRSDLRDAKAAAKDAQRHYEDELRWLEEQGDA